MQRARKGARLKVTVGVLHDGFSVNLGKNNDFGEAFWEIFGRTISTQSLARHEAEGGEGGIWLCDPVTESMTL